MMGGSELAHIETELIDHHMQKRDQWIRDIQADPMRGGDSHFNPGMKTTARGLMTEKEIKVTRFFSDFNFKFINFFTFGALGDD